MNHFHNTTQIEGQQLIDFESAAKGQEHQVLELMKSLQKAAFFEVKELLPDMHQDSLKRSLSNLVTAGISAIIN